MVERFMEDDVRTRLILSGLSELEERGVRDFSLRRAAESAGVSCAAPYRYFKGKEEYVAEIISYLASRWELMANEICKAHEGEGSSLVALLALSNVKFWLSNKKLRTALVLSGEEDSLVKPSAFDKRLCSEISSYLKARGIAEDDISERINGIRAMLIGYVTLVGSGELSGDTDLMRELKKQIDVFLR